VRPRHRAAVDAATRESCGVDAMPRRRDPVFMIITQEKALVQMTGHPLEKIKKDMSRDFYLSAHEAVQYGLIDKVLIPQPKGMGGGGLGLGDGLSSFV